MKTRTLRPALLVAVAASMLVPTRSAADAAPVSAPLTAEQMAAARGGNVEEYRYSICTPAIPWIMLRSYCLSWDN